MADKLGPLVKSAAPGAYNVVPGKVVLGLEIRDLSFDKIWELFHEIEKSRRYSSIEWYNHYVQKSITRRYTSANDKSIQEKIVKNP
jgi:N-carbamoyl-L-amino-acid hydrolase